jgi:DNA-binding YbaB/EbfC family protein
MKNMDDILRHAQLMQGKMAEMQEGLAKKSVKGSSGGGMVRAEVTGKLDVVSISIEKSVVDPNDVEMLQDLVVAAVNDALRQAKQMAEQEMVGLAGDFRIPGLM